jgi:hypothetical protein
MRTGELRHRHAEWLDPRWQQRWYLTIVKGGERNMKKFFANWRPMLWTLATVFVAALIAAVPTFGLNYKSDLLAAGAAVLTWIANAINPNYASYGFVAKRLRT